jgi:hypothetical protein
MNQPHFHDLLRHYIYYDTDWMFLLCKSDRIGDLRFPAFGHTYGPAQKTYEKQQGDGRSYGAIEGGFAQNAPTRRRARKEDSRTRPDRRLFAK